MVKDCQNLLKKIIDWTEQVRKSAGADGYIIGLSGGVDSSLLARICQKTGSGILGVIMPCASISGDLEDAKLLADKFDISYLTIDLTSSYNQLIEAFQEKSGKEVSKIVLANLKARLRMTTLYFLGNLNNYIVTGTGNSSEEAIGYFTKYGDGGVDILPIGSLFKSEVRELAQFLDIPEKIINKAPSAGLWPGQTDEEEIGVSYNKIEDIIRSLDKHLGKWSPSKLKIEDLKDEELSKPGYKLIIRRIIRNAHKTESPLLLSRDKLLEIKCLE